MDIVLVPGHWLGAWAWDDVAVRLRAHGHDVVAVTLPGLDPDDPDRAAATVTTQADHLAGVIASADAAPVVVVHSGANFPTSVLLDRNPSRVRRIVYVDSGPVADRSAFDASVAPDADEVPLPPFDDMQASLDGLSDGQLAAFQDRAVPQPGGVMREEVHLSNDARRDVPATFVCCSYPAAAVQQMAREGDPMMAETATLRNVEFVDLPTGHWPMWSRPDDLADAIAAAAR